MAATSYYANPFTHIPVVNEAETIEPVFNKQGNPWQIFRNYCNYRKHQAQFKLNAKTYLALLEAKQKQVAKVYQPEAIEEHARYVKVGDKYLRTYYLACLPNYVFAASMFKLINIPMPMLLSYHIKGTNKSAMIKSARQRLSVLESSQNSRSRKGKNLDPEITKEMQELQNFTNDLVHDVERSFLASVYITIVAESESALIDYDRKFQDATQDLEFTFNTYSFGQYQAWQSVLPLGEDVINEKQLLQTSAIINLLPFLTRNFNDPSGIFLGVNHYNNSLLLIDVFKARNANINIFGTSGSGKSVTAKLVMLRLALRGVQNIVIDPEGEYVELTTSLGGAVFKFDNQHGIDPFMLMQQIGGEITNQVQVLKHFLNYFVQARNQDNSILDKVILETFTSPGFVNFAKFINILERNIRNNQGLLNDLRQLAYGSMAGTFNNPSNIDFEAPFICFDLSRLHTDEQKIPLMYLIGNVINRIVDNRSQQCMIYIDEAHKLLHDANTTGFYIDLVKTARKRHAGVVTITQNPEDFKESDNSKTIITQAETTILLKQSTASVNYINRFDLFKLTKRECNDLGTFGVGEALFIREKEHIYIDIFPFKSEQELVFT